MTLYFLGILLTDFILVNLFRPLLKKELLLPPSCSNLDASGDFSCGLGLGTKKFSDRGKLMMWDPYLRDWVYKGPVCTLACLCLKGWSTRL